MVLDRAREQYGGNRTAVHRNYCQRRARQIPPASTLQQVLQHLRVNPEQVAVEKDRAIVRKPDWASTLIQAGAQLEIVQFVGGG